MEKKDYQSSVQALLFVLKKKILWIIAAAVCIALASALVTKLLIAPVYSSTAKFYVYNDPNNTSSALSSQDITAAKSLVDTYIVIIKSDSVLTRVVEKAGSNETPAEMRKMLSAGSLSGTAAFYLKVSDTDKEEAYKLTRAFVEVIPEVITEVVKAGGVSVFDEPEVAREADSPSLMLNTALGGIIGLVLSFLWFFLRELLDNTIYSEKDITDSFSYPVIGLIPTFAPQSGDRQERSGK